MSNKKKISLFASSLIVITIFTLMLFASEYFLVKRVLISKHKNKNTLELIKPDDILLYQDNLKTVGLLFQKELDSLKQLNETVAGTVQDNVKRRQVYKVKNFFKHFYEKNFYLDHVFLYNRFGRALTLWPFSEKIHNTIYNYPRYYQYLKNKIMETKKTATYFYLLDPYFSTNQMSAKTINQAPFYSLENTSILTQSLSHALIDIPTVQHNLKKLPFLIIATPIFYHRVYWGMSGITVPLSYLLDKFKLIGSENILAYYILSDNGNIIYSTDRQDIGASVKNDELFQNIKIKIEEYGNSGFVHYTNKIIFFYKTNQFIYLGVPIKFIGGMKKFVFKFPPFLFLFFVFEFFLILLLYILFYSKVISVLKNFNMKRVDDIEHFNIPKVEKNPLQNRIVSPLFVEAYKQHETDFSVPYFNVSAAGIFVTLHNVGKILKNTDEGGVLLNKFIETIYRLSSELDGYVEHLSFDSFMIYFGAPFSDSQYEEKSGKFIKKLLSQIQTINENSALKLKIGLAAEKGELFVSSFSFEGEEELVISGDLLSLLQKFVVVGTDNVAILGPKYYESNILEKNKVFETAEIKIRDRKETYKVFVYKL